MRLLLPALALATSLTVYAQAPVPPRKIQVLILTGQDKHPWRETTPYLREILSQTGRFEVRVAEEFRNGNLETLVPYDVAILNCSDEKLDIPSWSPATKAALLAFVRSGKGLVVYHHSAASFQDWRNSRNCWAASGARWEVIFFGARLPRGHPRYGASDHARAGSFMAKTDELAAV
jgi:hypothetical protein